MRTAWLLSLSVCALSLVVAPLVSAAPVTLTAVLNGANERPGSGDADGAGFAVVRLDPVAGTVSYSLLADGVPSPTAAHIHRGLADIAGPVVVNFAPNFANNASSGTVTAGSALIAEILSNPGAFYVNVHNAEFPGGAIRGQLVGAVSGSSSFSAALNGTNERPAAGDPDGTGSASVRIDRATNTVHYGLLVSDIAAPTMAHIHRGGSDVAGPVVVNFAPTFTAGADSGSVTASAAILDEILANPGGFYVNVHTADFPAGAVRGQLAPAPSGLEDAVIPIVGRVAGANGTFYRTDLSVVNVSGVATQVVLEYYASGFAGMSAPTATATFPLAANQQVNLDGDLLQTTLGVGDGTGAIRVVSSRAVTAGARVYNDRSSVDEGTLSQFVPALGAAFNRSSGVLSALKLQPGGGQASAGQRTNIGWFNAGSSTSTVTFRAHGADGTVLDTVIRDVPAGSQLQVPLSQLFPSVVPSNTPLYVTFTTTGAPLYVYASVVDNVNGDGMFIAAQAR